jgi:cytochrome b561
MTEKPDVFPLSSRILHWLMAPLVLAMLLIGVGMAASVSDRYHLLVSVHKPLGIAILVLIVVRIVNRLLYPPPPLPDTLSPIEKLAAKGSHILLYTLMVALPLIGWGMLSAGSYPVVLFGRFALPAILPQDEMLYGILRPAHTYLAYLLFATVLVHVGAALMHLLIKRDGVFESMATVAVGLPHEPPQAPPIEPLPLADAE